MNKTIVMKFAASAALIGTIVVGCKPAEHPRSLSSVAPRADKRAGGLAAKANDALARKDPATAVKYAEDAVALSPREAEPRILLGRAYLAAGRFVSAEATLADALVLAPGDGEAELSLALARIALGRNESARMLLVDAKGAVGESDRGLALALAGDTAGAVTVLEAAARAEGADAKARQNLALGYALAGRWAEAHSIAAQDLSPELVKVRLTEWAQLSQPRGSADQVAALLHVTPVQDAGMPAALALAQPANNNNVALAAADPAPTVPKDVIEAPAVVETAAAVAAPASRPIEVAAPEAAAAPYMMTAAAMTPPPLISAPARPARLLLARTKPAVAQQIASGRFVVQLGAFSSEAQVQTAWNKARRANRFANLAPSRATLGQRQGTVYRLSLAGFQTRGAATMLCSHIRSTGGACFVRMVAGDAPAAWGRMAGVRLASR